MSKELTEADILELKDMAREYERREANKRGSGLDTAWDCARYRRRAQLLRQVAAICDGAQRKQSEAV